MIFSRFRFNKDKILNLDEPQEAYVYYRNYRFDLLSGFPQTFKIESFHDELKQIMLQDRVEYSTVFHFFYEYGLLEMGHGHLIGEDVPLAIKISYKKHRLKNIPKPRLNKLDVRILEKPNWIEYQQAFKKIQEELLEGNCYQVNLTYPFDFYTEELYDPRDIVDFFFSRQGLGAFAHSTFIGSQLFLSNSPECLFQYRDNEIFTLPIKGTTKKGPGAWKKMLSNDKDRGELIMITDLLKNDLNRLGDRQAIVRKFRAPLYVPGLIHQYSLISSKLNRKISLYETMNSLFPGGSITGAPKKRVVEIISDVERFQRGFYCGSTVLCYKDKKMASINIRSATINPEERIWQYGAGGGITLLSKAHVEFQEMESKVQSFLSLFKAF